MKALLGLTYLKVELSFAYQLDNELASCYQRAHHAGRSQLITSLILISNALSFRYPLRLQCVQLCHKLWV